MTVAELIKELEKMPQDYNIIYKTYDEFGEDSLEDVTNILVFNHSKQIQLY